MSVGASGGKSASQSKSDSNTATNGTSTYTPNNPDWVTNALQQGVGAVTNIAGQDPSSYVAGASPLQQQQFGLAGTIGNDGAAANGAALTKLQGLANYVPGQVDPAAALSSLGLADPSAALQQALSGNVSNGYLPGALAANGAQAQSQFGQMASDAADTLARQVLPAIRSGGILAGQYGGSRQGIAEGVAGGDAAKQLALSAGQLSSNLGATNAGLLNTANENAQNRAATTGLGLAGLGVDAAKSNVDSGLAGAQLNDQAAQQMGALGLGDYSALAGSGSTQQSLQQALAGAPLSVLQQISAALGGLPLGLLQGGSTNTTGNSSTNANSSGTTTSVGLKVGA